MSAKEKQKSAAPRWAGVAGLLLLAALVVYWPALRGGFVMDDILWLQNNPDLKSFHGLLDIWRGGHQPDILPLTSTSFWIEWRLWGENPVGYHVTNVLLHAAGGMILWRVLRRLAIPGAWVAALLFVVHPVNVESVAWISERKNTLCLVFYLLSALWWLKSETEATFCARCYFIFSWLAFLLALLSKAAVVMLPVALLGCAWWLRGKIERRDWIRSLPFFGLSAVFGLVTLWFHTHQAAGEETVLSANFWARLAGAGRAVWFYLGKAVWPEDLAFIYPRWTVEAPSPEAYLPTMVLAAVAVAFWFYRRNNYVRAMAFGLGYFVIMLLPILGFVNNYYFLYSMVADHWQYFAIIGIIALAVGGMSSKIRILKIKVVLAMVAVMVLTAAARRQAALYGEPEKLWRDTVAKNPGSWVAQNSLGHYLGSTPEAIGHFRESLRLNPTSVETLVNLGSALLNTGQLEEARVELEKAKTINPQAWAIWFDLGLVFDAQNKNAEAEASYREAIRLVPDFASEHNNLGMVLQREGRMEEAVAEFHEALRLKPDWTDLLNNLAWLLATHPEAKIRDGAEAVRLATRAVELTHTNDPGTLDTLAAAYAEAGRWPEAMATATKALAIQPISPVLKARMEGRLELYRAGKPFRN